MYVCDYDACYTRVQDCCWRSDETNEPGATQRYCWGNREASVFGVNELDEFGVFGNLGFLLLRDNYFRGSWK